MATLTYISIFIFVVLLCAMSLTAGTQPSFSALATCVGVAIAVLIILGLHYGRG